MSATVPVARCPLTIRPATAGDYAFIDRLQDMHSKALGFMRKAALEGKIKLNEVLIAEDEDGVRELIARVLRDRGYQVVLARNGAEAIAGLRNGGGEPDLLLTDVIVPDMGTEELAGEVHKVVPELPILYMSGYPRDDILARGLLRTDQPFLQKPFTSEDLARMVGRMVQRA